MCDESCRGAFAVAGGNIPAARKSFADTASSAEGIYGDLVIDELAIDSRHLISNFGFGYTATPVSARTFAGPGDRLLASAAVSHDGDSSPGSYTRVSAVQGKGYPSFHLRYRRCHRRRCHRFPCR